MRNSHDHSIDGVVNFHGLGEAEVLQIVKKAVADFTQQLAEKRVRLTITDGCCAWLARRGYSPEFGAREIARLIQDKIKRFFVGGLYGVSLGRAFFGESMFTLAPNASKAALIVLIARLRDRGFDLIDCQVETPHLASLGARPLPRPEFCRRLKESLRHETMCGNWQTMPAPPSGATAGGFPPSGDCLPAFQEPCPSPNRHR